MALISSSLAIVIVAFSIFAHSVSPESMSTLNAEDLSRGQKIFVAHCGCVTVSAQRAGEDRPSTSESCGGRRMIRRYSG